VPVGDIFKSTAVQECSKDKKVASWLNDYNFNLLQNSKLNNSIKLNDSATGEE